ncbi:hypothetical protein Tco_0511778 [Tanacetum coccineum]
MVAAMKHMALNFAKLEKFEGVDFRRWQKKMHFLLSSMSVVYVLTALMLEDGGENSTVDQVMKRAKWDNDDYVYRGLILNGMSDSLFDVYQNVETSKELWDTLEAKYMAEDASSKKFLVSCIIDKLPPSWKDFKHTLKHMKEELTLIKLGSHLRIEESLRAQYNDKPKGNNVSVEEEPVKIKRKDQGIDQIERDEELSHKLHEEELAEIARIQEEKAAQEEASRVSIMEMFDEVQAGIDADALFATKLQQEEREEYIIEERAKFLAEIITAQRKFRAAQRAAKIRSRPPTKS